MRTLTEFKVHPTAALFPLIQDEDFDELKESIRREGLIDAIVVAGDELIDGRNRLLACEATGTEPRFIEWQSLQEHRTKSDWILAKNITRRHLTEDVRVMVWAKGQKNALKERAELKKQESRFKPGECHSPNGRAGNAQETAHMDSCEPNKRDGKAEHARSTVGQVAAGAGVSHHKAAQAVAVANGSEELASEVINGKSTIPEAFKKVMASKPKRKRAGKPLKDKVLSWLSAGIKKFGDSNRAEVVKFILEELQ